MMTIPSIVKRPYGKQWKVIGAYGNGGIFSFIIMSFQYFITATLPFVCKFGWHLQRSNNWINYSDSVHWGTCDRCGTDIHEGAVRSNKYFVAYEELQ